MVERSNNVGHASLCDTCQHVPETGLKFDNAGGGLVSVCVDVCRKACHATKGGVGETWF